MAANSSTKAVVLALVGNGFLTVLKFVTFAVSGSGAMFSEAIHSCADTGNQALLYVGIRRSEKPPNRMFHYGYGGERFFTFRRVEDLHGLHQKLGLHVGVRAKERPGEEGEEERHRKARNYG